MEEDLHEHFRKILRMMLRDFDRMFEEMAKEGGRGFIFTYGPEGPQFKEIGGDELTQKEEVIDAREPLVDIFEEDKGIKVLVELPGVKRENIEVEFLPPKMVVVKTKDGSFFKRVILPKPVEGAKAKSKYRNGILELFLPYGRQTRKGKKIKVE